MRKALDRLDQFNIYASSILSGDDFSCLNLLYQPLIGKDAKSLYETLFSLIERNGYRSELIFSEGISTITGLTIEEIDLSLKKLEAIGLIDTYLKNDLYILLLKQPLAPSLFLEDSIFGTYLHSEVGDTIFQVLVDHFKIDKFDRRGYKNVSATFDEIFETRDLADININGKLLGRKPNVKISIDKHKFDFDDFLSQIDESSITGSMETFKKNITRISFVYKFNEEDLVSLYGQSIDSNGFNLKLLEKNAILKYKYLNKNETPKLGVKEPPVSQHDEAIAQLVDATVVDMLDICYPNYDANDLESFSLLYAESKIDTGILNVLVFGMLRNYLTNNKELPPLSYMKKALKTWTEKKFSSPREAFLYNLDLKDLRDRPQSNKNSKNASSVKSNKWADEYEQDIMKGMKRL